MSKRTRELEGTRGLEGSRALTVGLGVAEPWPVVTYHTQPFVLRAFLVAVYVTVKCQKNPASSSDSSHHLVTLN